ncbi:MAG: GNAT family protein [Bdellovibrionia bacterium]
MAHNLELRPFSEEFITAFWAWRTQPSSLKHNPILKVTYEETLAGCRGEGFDLSDLKKFEKYRFYAVLDGKPVANVSVKNISHSQGYAEIGYGVDESLHGKGIGTETVRLAVTKVFKESPLTRITALVHDKNTASLRLLDRLGFTREGLLREHFVINGIPANEVFFGLLKKEWKV